VAMAAATSSGGTSPSTVSWNHVSLPLPPVLAPSAGSPASASFDLPAPYIATATSATSTDASTEPVNTLPLISALTGLFIDSLHLPLLSLMLLVSVLLVRALLVTWKVLTPAAAAEGGGRSGQPPIDAEVRAEVRGRVGGNATTALVDALRCERLKRLLVALNDNGLSERLYVLLQAPEFQLLAVLAGALCVELTDLKAITGVRLASLLSVPILLVRYQFGPSAAAATFTTFTLLGMLNNLRNALAVSIDDINLQYETVSKHPGKRLVLSVWFGFFGGVQRQWDCWRTYHICGTLLSIAPSLCAIAIRSARSGNPGVVLVGLQYHLGPFYGCFLIALYISYARRVVLREVVVSSQPPPTQGEEPPRHVATDAQTPLPPVPPAEAAQPPSREDVCVICMDFAATHAPVPCGHRSLCHTCAGTLISTAQQFQLEPECVVCRQPVREMVRIFLSGSQ